MVYFADRRDHAIPFFVDANILPLSFLYYEYVSNQERCSNLMHEINNNNAPLNILKFLSKNLQHTDIQHAIIHLRSQKKIFSALSFDLKVREPPPPPGPSPGFATASYLASFNNCSMITSLYTINESAIGGSRSKQCSSFLRDHHHILFLPHSTV